MAQRINWAANNVDTSQIVDTLVGVGQEDQVVDLFLAHGSPVQCDRAKERRKEIDNVYLELHSCNALILTLGLIECWFDEEHGYFLNRMPPVPLIHAHPDRYTFRRMSVRESLNELIPAISNLISKGTKSIILTVSPVPIQQTFTGQDCVVANSFSKSVLRICTEELLAEFPKEVNYFPSYEIVCSGGLTAFQPDNVHVESKIISRVIQYMLANYVHQSTN